MTSCLAQTPSTPIWQLDNPPNLNLNLNLLDNRKHDDAHTACLRGFHIPKDPQKFHTHVIKTGLESHIVQATKLVQMYGKAGHTDDARQVFDKMPQRNLVSWNVMIGVYVHNGEAEEVLKLFRIMQRKRGHLKTKMSHFTASSVLKACAELSALKNGKEIHAHLLRSGFQWDIIQQSALIDMYAKGRSTSDARKVFDEMPLRNALSWKVMISGYARNDCEEKALDLILQMQEAGVSPNQYVISSMIKVCVSLGLLDLGKQLHGLVVKSGLQSHVIVGSASFDFYVKCCCMEEAHSVLGEIPWWDVVSWTAMIGEYV